MSSVRGKTHGLHLDCPAQSKAVPSLQSCFWLWCETWAVQTNAAIERACDPATTGGCRIIIAKRGNCRDHITDLRQRAEAKAREERCTLERTAGMTLDELNNYRPEFGGCLVVNDEETIGRSLTWELQLDGFVVTGVSSGSEAVNALEQEQFELVITDMIMPGADGFAVFKTAKRLSPFTTVLILAGYGNMRSAIDALRFGPDDFTLKPCEVEELVLRIGRCLEKQTLLRRLSLQNQCPEKEIEYRQRVEAQLQDNENRFRLALDSSSNGVWERNLVTGETYFGENWHRSLGYEDISEISGQAFEQLLHPDDRDRVLALREAHLRGDSPRYEAEYRLRNKVGDWQWILS